MQTYKQSSYIHTNRHTNIQTYIQTNNTNIHTYIHTYIHTQTHTYVQGNTKHQESTRSWTAKVQLVHSWADKYIHQEIAIHYTIEFYEPMIKH